MSLWSRSPVPTRHPACRLPRHPGCTPHLRPQTLHDEQCTLHDVPQPLGFSPSLHIPQLATQFPNIRLYCYLAATLVYHIQAPEAIGSWRAKRT
jgi:hypothetical protein